MKKLTLFSIFLAAVVIILGAYTRLTDAGLGCPDWPGCYGNLTVPLSEEKVAQANAAYPERPVEAFKAWNEMIHRYFAGTLGLCVLAIAVIALRQRDKGTPVKLPLLLLGLIIFQAALGMWTVTLNLLPVVVMGHLLGGFSVLSCLFILYLRLRHIAGDAPETKPSPLTSAMHDQGIADLPRARAFQRNLKLFAFIGLGVLVTQIALGGWTSANYAALACTDMPVCESGWPDRIDIAGAFSVPDADNYEFGAHDYGERVTMHIAHRFGAAITFLYFLVLGISVLVSRHTTNKQKYVGAFMLVALCTQVALGLSNIIFMLPLSVAVMHNAVAAVLLLSSLNLIFTVFLTLKSANALSTETQNTASFLGSKSLQGAGAYSIQEEPLHNSMHDPFTGSTSSHILPKAPGGFHG
ncbi:COX15/CtaA family protein [Alteromonas sp. ALT199]|uniref:COX15/CtaA family protein n=1 Tax=unclassified Alteromonas TaxID=2614992 RepID=UPI001BECB677|nr:COX15/CtaA family protein [Alteromonas sp. ALT199]MBT3135298.1 COX15/CtaA family protein [Alteromonas sp. ALT199]